MGFVIPLYVSHTPSSLNAASERRRGFQTASENLIAIQLSGMVNRWCHLYSFSLLNMLMPGNLTEAKQINVW
jgi:hypothetical protein